MKQIISRKSPGPDNFPFKMMEHGNCKDSPNNTGDDIRYQYDEGYFKFSRLRSKHHTDMQYISELQYMRITKLHPVIQMRNYDSL